MDSSNNGSPPDSAATDNLPVEVILASWADRFMAWLIDFIIVSIGSGVLFALLALPFWWTYFEHTSGQSIGKRLLKIKSTDVSGNDIDIKSAALESFGKSFLLPLDVILGWLLTNNKRQRIFNKISNTVVIKLKPREELNENIRYRKD